jgi:redox-sensitive bicupin YhaK (pirin superfamily)
MSQGSEIFQIWFDPNLEETMSKPASYDDYKAAEFPQREDGIANITTLAGSGSSFWMDAPGIEVFRLDLAAGTFRQPVENGKIYSVYVLDGTVVFDGQAAQASDFIQISEQEDFEITTTAPAQLFVIASPLQPGYKTYAQLMMRR